MTTPQSTGPTPALPAPTGERWQPLRLGLIDLFYYDEEEFWFHDGRLLLRGNNGTGKSKVLALTLPFLLDASTAGRRVEPDADPKKRMEWNLLLAGAHPAPERTGYSWVEFGRIDAAGMPHFLTLGIGLKAAAGRGMVKQWNFTTTRRIGDLRLVDDTRTVLPMERLRDEITGSGQVYGTQSDYRRAVDEALFRLGEERYGALIDLLIQLRQPQLSMKPDERALSAALTEALAPLDQAVVADVAESFRSLEDERHAVDEAKETHRAAEDFLRHYRAYARVASRRRTSTVRLANSAYEHAGRDLRQAQESWEAATGEVARLASLRETTEQRRGDLQGRERALRESPEMKDATRLEQAATSAGEAEEASRRADAEEDRARTAAVAEQDEAARAREHHEQAQEDARRQGETAARLAGAAGLAGDHERALTDAAAADRALTRRRDQVRYIRGLIDTVRRARDHSDQQRRAVDAAEADAAGRAEEVEEAREEVGDAVAHYRSAAQTYAGALNAIVLDQDAHTLADSSEQWARSLEGAPPLVVALDAAVPAALDRIAHEQARAQHLADRAADDLAGVRERIEELEGGRDPEPPPTPGRDPDARDGAPGAPLWWLTDFSPDLPAEERAGLEAALQSAGLLDSWIFPDGRLDLPGDVVLGAHGDEFSRSLAHALLPAGDGVDHGTIRGILSRIGWGEESGAPVWVDAHGRWGAGPARGSWAKERAEYLGAGAREAHRQELLAELREQAGELESELADAHQRVSDAQARARAVRQERAEYPQPLEREVADSHSRFAAAQRELERAQARSAEAQASWEQARAVAAKAQEQLEQEAEELALGSTPADLDDTATAINDYAVALATSRAAARGLAEAATALARAEERSAQAEETLAQRAQERAESNARATRQRSLYEELHRSVGASVAELQARLEETTAALEGTERDLADVTARQLAAAAEEGRLERTVNDLGRRRDEANAEREAQCEELRHFAGTGLLRVALPEQEVPGAGDWTLTAAVDLSRAVEQQLTEIASDDDAWARVQQRVSGAATELTTQMSRHGHQARQEQRGDVLVVRVRYLQEEIDVDHLAERLEQDVADRERLLSARERQILENHLVNEVAGHLHELMGDAEAQIVRMNEELKNRRTSTGMQLRMQWRERGDGPAGLAETKRLMIRSDATWTAEDRTAIGEFLQEQIARVRHADPTGGWQEHLEQALDYRQWHTFTVERWQNGQWRSASGPASGGERALAMSVPLFAAASAHYNSADPLAPRLILLDEAFAGVDDDSRAKSLGLLATFDLDVVMTSEREWGCYPEVPGLSIAQLSRREGIDAVGVTRWRWDGARRQRVEDPAAAVAPAADDDLGLFG